MMLLQNKKVAIIGGGPGGLTLARLLQQAGVDVKVYERDVNQSVRQQGSTLDMHHDTGLAALEAAGLTDEFKKTYRPGADRGTVVDVNMKVLIDADGDKPEEDFGNPGFRPEIDRGPLRDMLINSIESGNIVWNSRFTGMKPAGGGWEISFDNNENVYADLVIGADGANSKVRKHLSDIKAVYSGATSIEVTIPRADLNAPKAWALANGGSMYALNNGKTIFSITKGDGTLSVLIGMAKPESWLNDSGIDLNDRHAVADWFKVEFSDWSPEWLELFSSETVIFVPRPWYHFPPDQHWTVRSNLTIIGDAAHRIPPYAGEGANQALADALDLYHALTSEKFSTLHEAIAAYETKMFERSAEITIESLTNTTNFHSKDNFKFLMSLFGDSDNSK